MGDKSTRDAFREALAKQTGENPAVTIVEAGTDPRSALGQADSLAAAGKLPFFVGRGPSLAGGYDLVREIAYAGNPLRLVGEEPGLDDFALLRGLPGVTCLEPADETSTHAAVKIALTRPGLTYLRLATQPAAPLYRSEQVFQCGRGIIVKEGGELALLGMGPGLVEALKASEDLAPHNPWVIDLHTIVPLDRALLLSIVRPCRWVVTVEDHAPTGGLGSAVAEILSEAGFGGRLLRIGVRNVPEAEAVTAARVVRETLSLVDKRS